MTKYYLDHLIHTIRENEQHLALSDFYLTEDGTAQDTARGNHYTYGEMYEEILHVCDIFRSLGLQKGDHIAICGANSAHWIIAYLAITAFNGVVVTIIPSQVARDMTDQITFSDAKALFTDTDIWEELKDQSLPQIEHVIILDNWGIQFSKGSNSTYQELQSNNLAMICFTSGSTGTAKGVMLSHQSISNVITGFNRLMVYEKYRHTNMLAFLPMAHIYGLLVETLLPLYAGCTVFIPRDVLPKQTMHLFSIVRPKIAFMVPAIVPLFLNDIIRAKEVLRGLDFLVVAGAFMQDGLEDFLLANRVPVATGYGLTECCSCCSWQVPHTYRKAAVGTIVPGMTSQIALNGEILVRGENVMLGYYKDPDATARKIDKDGWLHTGDKGHLDDDGYLYVEGRLEQDMIVLPNGENIHPEDIERKINALPEVKESIVLARDGKLVAIVVPSSLENRDSKIDLRRNILRTVNPQLPLYSQLYDVEITDTPLRKTEKQTIKRYLYK